MIATDAPEQDSVRSLCVFLSKYSAALLGYGATCIRLTNNVNRMAEVFGKRIEITIMPRHVLLAVVEDGCAVATAMAAVPATGISFDANSRLSRLSWDVADGKVGFQEAERRFEGIIGYGGGGHVQVLLLVAAANASFCRLFGGDAVAMAIVFVATMAGFYIRQLLGEKVDARVKVLVCSFVSSVLGATGILFGLGATPEVALATSVLYLVPGIPFLNSFSDLLYRHYVCAFSRLVEAAVLTCCLSAGLCLGMLLMNVGMF